MSASSNKASIVIRDIEAGPEMHAVELLQKEVWGVPDLDVVPSTHLVAAKAAGGVLLGAFHGKTLVGFVYGFPSYEYGQLAHHSHMLAVKPEFRSLHLGHELKLAQRERVLEQGSRVITWTFDPLQSLNAYFNLNKLGAIADRYLPNFYGEDATSFLHQNGTDRLWVSWLLTSPHVKERIAANAVAGPVASGFALVQFSEDGSPLLNDFGEAFSHGQILIDIPGQINVLQKQSFELAVQWRESTRRAFTEALAAGYLVSDFIRRSSGGQTFGSYVLTRDRPISDYL